MQMNANLAHWQNYGAQPIPLQDPNAAAGGATGGPNTTIPTPQATTPPSALGQRTTTVIPTPPTVLDGQKGVYLNGQWVVKEKKKSWNPFKGLGSLFGRKKEYIPPGASALSFETISRMNQGKPLKPDQVQNVLAATTPAESAILREKKVMCPVEYGHWYDDLVDRTEKARAAGLPDPEIYHITGTPVPVSTTSAVTDPERAQKIAEVFTKGQVGLTPARMHTYFSYFVQPVLGKHPRQHILDALIQSGQAKDYNFVSDYGLEYVYDSTGLWVRINGEYYPFDPGDLNQKTPDTYLGVDRIWRRVTDHSGLRQAVGPTQVWDFYDETYPRPSLMGAAPSLSRSVTDLQAEVAKLMAEIQARQAQGQQ